MLRLAAKADSSALLNIHKPPPEHPRYRSWFMDTLRAVQKAGIPLKRVRTNNNPQMNLAVACSSVPPLNTLNIKYYKYSNKEMIL